MWMIIVFAFVLRSLRVTESSIVSFGIIHNTSLNIPHGNTTTVNGTCETCLCALVSDPSLFSLNCFINNLTCEMHSKADQGQSCILADSKTSEYYFISLPTYKESTILEPTTALISTSSPLFAVEYLWTFDTTFQDDLAMFNAIPVNNATFSSTSITGHGSSLSLSSSLSQYLNISSPRLKLYDQSWTFEAWIFITNITGANEFAIVGQCKPISNDTCLHLVVKFKHLYFGTWFDDLTGNTTLLPSRWYHVAFTFDCDTRIQSVYLDGVIDGSRQANVCFQGRNQSLTIGAVDMSNPERFFDGMIDQLSFTNRTRSADEILRDATMTAHFSFDNDSIVDQGPLGINGSLVGDTSFVAGRVGQALEVQNINESYLQVQGLVLLGTSNRSYSFSIWIRPYLLVRSVIIYATSLNGNSWCLPLLGLTNSSHLMTYSWDRVSKSVIGPAVVANNWTHVAVTYSSTNGLRLYVNGTLTNTSVPFSFVPSGTPLFLLLGNPDESLVCGSLFETYGPYTGALDEFRLYSRELTALDVAALACP